MAKHSIHTVPNTRVERDGYSFASKLEATVYQYLKLREKAGELKVIQCQAHVYLTDARILYIPDFKCELAGSGEILFVESKGFESQRWPIIKKLWLHFGPAVLEIWGGHHLKPFLSETIVPRTKP